MCFRSKVRRIASLVLWCAVTALLGQARVASSVDGRDLSREYNHAQELQQAGKLREAAQQYRAFLAGALEELATGYAEAADEVHSVPLFDEALALQPQSTSLILDAARAALMTGDLVRARTLATDFINNGSGEREKLAQAHQLLGRTLLKLNQDQEARKEFEAAVQLDPTFPNGYDLAVACLDLNDDRCAAQIFTEMEKSFGDTPELHMAFGRAYAESDFQPKAIVEFQRAVDENPHLPNAHYLIAAMLLATGSAGNPLNAAEAELKKELLISPGNAMTYAALAKVEIGRGNYPAARDYLNTSVSLDPKNPDPYLYLGQMYFSMNRLDEAETALRRCVQLTADISRNRYQVQKAHYLLGRILMKKGLQDAAHAEMEIDRGLAEQVLAQDKSKLANLLDTRDGEVNPLAAVSSRSSAGSAINNPVALKAVEALGKQLTPAIAGTYNNLGVIAAAENEYANAIAHFQRAAAWNPALDGLDYNWGRAAFAGALYADAIPPLSRYLKAHPDDTGARSVLGISEFMTDDYHACLQTLQSVMRNGGVDPLIEYSYDESLIRTGQIRLGTERLAELEKAHPEFANDRRASTKR